MRWPVTDRTAADPAAEQMVRRSRLAPNRWKKRRSIEPYCSTPIVPAGVGQNRLCPVFRDNGGEAVGDGLQGLLPGDRANCPEPFGPTRFMG